MEPSQTDDLFEAIQDPDETMFATNGLPILPIESHLISITYSNAVDIVLTETCRNTCGYCDFQNKKCIPMVPYATIKAYKEARKHRAREANMIAGERPDKFNTFRAKLDLWGFGSYAEYVYTVCELAFLEGLLCNLNIGYLTENELRHLAEIAVSFEMSLETTNEDLLKTVAHENAPSKDPAVRLKFLQSCGKLNLPTVTGMLVGIGESSEDRIRTINAVKAIHEEYGNIQMFKIQNFIPRKGTPMENWDAPSEKVMLETVALARDILSKDIRISVPININHDVIKFIEHGVNDFCQIRYAGKDTLFHEFVYPDLIDLTQLLKEHGYQLDKRLPIANDFVLQQKYSRKVGQLLDKYKLRIKTEPVVVPETEVSDL